ncbi:hypothetical protein QFZ75_002836 [Streptomyces sp. V3I8]|nr:hypothetical protein [Streptomyces sp. V3I8]
MEGLEAAVGVEDDWLDWLDGDGFDGAGAAAAAGELAAENDASVTAVTPYAVAGFPGFQVEIRTDYTVGDSIIPGTEGMHATAEAAAVIKPRCDFDVPDDPKDVVELDCDGELVDIDPEDFDLDDLPDASVLFSVHLAE